MKLALVPCAATEWHAAGRLLGRADLSPGPAADAQLSTWGAQLAPLAPVRVLHSPDGLAAWTARALAKPLKATVRSVDDLAEADLGVWAGLTEEQLSTRFASAYRQLEESPLSVTPPGGENLGQARERLARALARALRNVKRNVAVVLRPVALALLMQELTGLAEAQVWEARGQDGPLILDYPPAPAAPAAEGE